ncbi:PREDICTED: dynein assembly factor 3, axonemal-like [Acropora digitifera]|uniref:dynein assembly factor 3, axonemal-like n=1 Tax=Acropora digitifera TaxID=70779 RepID=UPI00077A0173|nr:PREDICTED: dynein assembly factor 3, axonemal-like [Acropora digitifera]
MMMDGFGAITWWGFSPALDLQGKYQFFQSLSLIAMYTFKWFIIVDEVFLLQNHCLLGKRAFLVVGAGDCRHILKTIVYACRHGQTDLDIFVVENNLEIYARDFLLLSIAFEPKERLGLQEKTELFLELFGNSLVRPQTSEYLQQKSSDFIRFITDLDYLEASLPVFNFSQLKFKERDQLESIFKFWRNPDPKLFDILTKTLLEIEAEVSIIHGNEYKSWREQGVAFELRSDSTYEVSNRTLASGLIIKRDGERFARRGYWGDVINSPYLAFGIESEEKSLFKTSNGQHVKTSTLVSEYNVTALMHELMTGEMYTLPQSDDKKEAKKGKATLEELAEEIEEVEETEKERKEIQEGANMKKDSVCQAQGKLSIL